MYSGTDNAYTEIGWGGGTYSSSYTVPVYSTDHYQSDANLQIVTQTSQTQTSQTQGSYRPIQQPSYQTGSAYFTPNATRFGQSTDHGFQIPAGQQSQFLDYSDSNDVSNEGRYRDRSGAGDYFHRKSETELDKFSRYDQTEDDYYSQSLSSSKSSMRPTYNTSLQNKQPPKRKLKTLRHNVEKKKYDHPRSVASDTGIISHAHSRKGSFNQARESNVTYYQDPTDEKIEPHVKDQHSDYAKGSYFETVPSFPPRSRVERKRPKKKKNKKINASFISSNNFSLPPPSQRTSQPALDRTTENDTESFHMKHELEVKEQQLKVASDLLTKQGEMLKRLESNMNKQFLEGMVPHKVPPVPDIHRQLSPGDGRISSQVTDNHWYPSGIPPAKRSRFSNMNTNRIHPPVEDLMDTAPYLTKRARRKLAKRSLNPGVGGLLNTTQPGLMCSKKNANAEMNVSLFNRPEDVERGGYLSKRVNLRNPRSLPSLLGSSPESVASKYGQHCQQCGLEFFHGFNKHVSNPMHMRRKTRILTGCKPCNVVRFRDYEEYLSHNSLSRHQKIMKIVQANRDSKYPFQGVKVTCPEFDPHVTHGSDLIKEITSHYCEACDKLIPSKKKGIHLHSKGHYNNWVLHLRIQKFKSLVTRERELKNKSGEKETTATIKDETNKTVAKNLDVKVKKGNKPGKNNTNKIIARKSKTDEKICTNKLNSESKLKDSIISTAEATAEKHTIISSTKETTSETAIIITSTKESTFTYETPIIISSTAETTSEKLQDISPTETSLEATESTAEIQETKADQSEDAVEHDDSVIDTTTYNKAKDLLQEKVAKGSHKTEVVESLGGMSHETSDHTVNDNYPEQDETATEAGMDENVTPYTKEMEETCIEGSGISKENQSCEEEDRVASLAPETVRELNREDTTDRKEDHSEIEKNVGKEITSQVNEMENQTPTTKRRTRQSPRVRK